MTYYVNNKLMNRYSCLIPITLIILGCFFRIAQYISNRSLWIDEAMLALNILERTPLELLKPLSYNQGAPVGFLLSVKGLTLIAGESEYILRLLPLFSGITVLILSYEIFKKWCTSIVTILILIILCFSPRLIYYSSEFKQYSTDVAVVCLLYYLVIPIISQVGPDITKFLRIIIAGILSLIISHSSIFVLTTIGIVLIINFAIKRDKANISLSLLSLLFWLFGFYLLYKYLYLGTTQNSYLTSYWDDFFIPKNPFKGVLWLIKAFPRLFANPYGLSNRIIAVFASILFTMGVILTCLKDWKITFILLGPMFLVLCASALKKYPFGDRLVLFFLPSLAYFIINGTVLSVKMIRWKKLTYIITALIMVIILQYPVKEALIYTVKPNRIEHIRPVLMYLKDNYKKEDKLYIYELALPAYKYYSYFHNLPAKYIIGKRFQKDSSLDLLGSGSAFKNRVWILISHLHNQDEVSKWQMIMRHLNLIGKQLSIIENAGASLYLYDFISN